MPLNIRPPRWKRNPPVKRLAPSAEGVPPKRRWYHVGKPVTGKVATRPKIWAPFWPLTSWDAG